MPLQFVAQGPMQLPAVGGYTGPGDLISGATAWWGLRGYNAAYTGNAVDLVDQSGANPLTVAILSGGNLNTAAISAWVTANSVTTIRVTKLYDQTGNGIHFTQTASAVRMPKFNLTGLNSKPCWFGDNSGSTCLVMNTPAMTQAQPFNLSAVINNTNGTQFELPLLHVVGGNDPISLGLTGGTEWQFGMGNDTNVVVSTNVAHAVNATYNGASSTYNVDGSETSGNASTGAISSQVLRIGGRFDDGTSDTSFYKCSELGLWSTAWNTTQRNLIGGSGTGGQKAYWGTP